MAHGLSGAAQTRTMTDMSTWRRAGLTCVLLTLGVGCSNQDSGWLVVGYVPRPAGPAAAQVETMARACGSLYRPDVKSSSPERRYFEFRVSKQSQARRVAACFDKIPQSQVTLVSSFSSGGSADDLPGCGGPPRPVGNGAPSCDPKKPPIK